MAEYEKKVRKILMKHGCFFKRHGKGDHDIWFSPIVNHEIVVDGRIKSRFMANEIMKQAGLTFRFR